MTADYILCLLKTYDLISNVRLGIYTQQIIIGNGFSLIIIQPLCVCSISH